MTPKNNTKQNKRNKRHPRKRNKGGGASGLRVKPQAAPKKASIGSQIGSKLGDFAQKGFTSLFGFGDYTDAAEEVPYEVEVNSMLASNQSNYSSPEFEYLSGESDAVIVRHREFLGDFSTTVTWSNGTYIINPCYKKSFPWLSKIARNYQQWSPLGIVYEVVSTCGNAVSSTNAALGTTIVSTQYNAFANPFIDKTQALNNYFASSAKTSENQVHPIECKIDERPTPILYTYSHLGNTADEDPVLYSSEDRRLNDLGIVNVAHVGSQAVYTAGELWVSYEIALLKPWVQRYAAPFDLRSKELALYGSVESDAIERCNRILNKELSNTHLTVSERANLRDKIIQSEFGEPLYPITLPPHEDSEEKEYVEISQH